MTLDIQSMEALAHYTRGGVTIFFVFWCFLLRKYEKRSYMLKLLYFSSLLIAVCQWLYMQFLDGGRLLGAYRAMMSMPEMQPVLKVYGLSQQQVDDALAQMFSPLTLASYSFIMACIAGGIGSIIIAAIMKK